ncbi:MAG: plastocyanin/azurin family copper-binding protein [Actinomycetota bacterium]|nr:plastocyanin/azurin family copper-binding protein [Actinomycetota bacterium]
MREILVGAAVAVLLTSCSEEQAQVEMTDANRFEPDSIEVSANEQIVFSNLGDAAHTVTAYQDSIPEGGDYFSSGEFETELQARDHIAEALIAPRQEFTITLEEPGTYRYFCIPHESQGMTGRLVVR